MDLDTLVNTVAPTNKVKRRVKRTSSAHNPFAPVSKQGGATSLEIGLLISLAVIGLYMYGFFESIRSLPNAHVGLDGVHNLGGNINLARVEANGIDGTEAAVSLDAMDAPKKAGQHMDKGVPTANIVLPDTKWPVTIKTDKNLEKIIHPGDGHTEMFVPHFWSPPIHNGELMSRETAMKIGSCTEPDHEGNFVRGDKCPEELRTIFVTIASYRDFQCRFTIESAFLRAKNPDRIRVGEFVSRTAFTMIPT